MKKLIFIFSILVLAFNSNAQYLTMGAETGIPFKGELNVGIHIGSDNVHFGIVNKFTFSKNPIFSDKLGFEFKVKTNPEAGVYMAFTSFGGLWMGGISQGSYKIDLKLGGDFTGNGDIPYVTGGIEDGQMLIGIGYLKLIDFSREVGHGCSTYMD